MFEFTLMTASSTSEANPPSPKFSFNAPKAKKTPINDKGITNKMANG